ncbi:hypothetical protein CRP01_37735 [Flavilitoribacter nigricans DSM 23189 = NBRC 102662]|uniref:Uncharacterized protein n=1 Tax=Flavilitoribacter nigricans (strain ATCC 23147 / DSM 23189 / NBRC 102662 / NCIMB 1420 / SS-2) TaxID=1122177 RepID=A0A2D0MYH7_FLAN2|nr:hypothetical protein CRP01_37735 [Flavilitoribacter nigricans DSM 23189 = NBRC 102662]
MTWLILGLGFLFGCQWTPSSESTVENYWLKGDTVLIRLRDGSGWRLDLYQEGRGSVRYGRHPNNILTFERTGFDFDSLRWRLTDSHDRSQKPGVFRRPPRIAFLLNDTEREESEILQDIDLGREVFELAFEAGLNGKADLRAKRRMLKLFRNNPPFSN